tara:strand:+ start:228 stop:548 length:321 start_codon:yes stop_codon:yes gene_type:complete
MATFSTTDDKFENDILESKVPVLVDFWAQWCGPCIQVAPILETIAEENQSKLKVLKLNIDENPIIPQKYGVRGIPTLMIFKKGNLVDSKVGSLPKTTLESWIKSNL